MAEEPRDPNAPSLETLMRLKQQLPGMMADIKSGKVGSKGKPTKKVPRGFCVMCAALIDYEWPVRGEPARPLKEGSCKKCNEMLNGGYIGARDPEGRAVFIKATPELRESIFETYGKRGAIVLDLPKAQFQNLLEQNAFELPKAPDLGINFQESNEDGSTPNPNRTPQPSPGVEGQPGSAASN